MHINLSDVVDYLYEHHDQFFVLPGLNGALVYDKTVDQVVAIWGDFSGTPADQSAELRLGLQRHRAWLN